MVARSVGVDRVAGIVERRRIGIAVAHAVAQVEAGAEEDLRQRVWFPLHAEIHTEIVVLRAAAGLCVLVGGAVARQEVLSLALAKCLVVGVRIAGVAAQGELLVELLAEVQAGVA